MNNLFHRYITIIIIFSLSCLLSVSCAPKEQKSLNNDNNPHQKNINYLLKDWLYDPAMPKFFPYIAALQDFVFVGEIVSDPVAVKLGDNSNYDIYSQYDVRVLLNIRGTLKCDITIPVLKDGGYDEAKKYYVLSEYDSLPQKGEICIIVASTMSDGSYRLSTCGFTSFTAIGIAENFYRDNMLLSNGITINKDFDLYDKSIALSNYNNYEKIIDISSIENGLIFSNRLIQNPDSDEMRLFLTNSTLARLWTESVSDEYAVECKRNRIMDSPYGMPGSPSYSEQILPYPEANYAG